MKNTIHYRDSEGKMQSRTEIIFDPMTSKQAKALFKERASEEFDLEGQSYITNAKGDLIDKGEYTDIHRAVIAYVELYNYTIWLPYWALKKREDNGEALGFDDLPFDKDFPRDGLPKVKISFEELMGILKNKITISDLGFDSEEDFIQHFSTI